MYKKITDDFYKTLLEVINTPNASSFILTSKERQTLGFLINNYKDFLDNENELVSTFKNKLAETKENLDFKTKNNIASINLNFETEKKQILEHFDKQIKEINDKIKKQRQDENLSIKKINDKISIEEKFLSNSLPLIDSALLNNNEYYDNLILEAKKNYDDYLHCVTKETDELINKLNSENNKQFVLKKDKLYERIDANNVQIEKFKEDILKIKLELAEKELSLKSKILASSKSLNEQINQNRFNKSLNENTEFSKYNLKISDIEKQLDDYSKKHNDKTKKILDEYVNTTADLNDQVHDIQVEYEKSVETYSRNYYYNYYNTLFELNSYYSSQKTESTESRSIKRANKKLYNLKLNSYYEKLDDLKNNFEEQIKLFKQTYDIKLEKINLERTLVETYKNYELNILNIELECQKQNLNTLKLFIDKQYEANIKLQSIALDISTKDAIAKNDVTLEELRNELQRVTLAYQIKIEELEKTIYAREANTKLLIEKFDVSSTYYNNVYDIRIKLEKIVSMLLLDKNNYVHDYNIYQSEFHKQISKFKADNDKKLINANIKYHQEIRPAKISLIQNEIAYNIDTLTSSKLKLEYDKAYNLEKIRFEQLKKSRLNDLTTKRKDFRFDCLYIYHIGDSFYKVIKQCLLLEDTIIETLKQKFDDSNYIVLANKILKVFYTYIVDLIILFTNIEKSIIEDRIDNITKVKYDNYVVKFSEETESKIETLKNTNKELEKLINSYNNTIKLKLEDIIKNKRKIKELNLLIFNFETFRIKKHIREDKQFIKNLNKKIKQIIKYINNNEQKIIKLREQIKINQRDYDKEKKSDYKSYYKLINKSLKTKKTFLFKLNNNYNNNKNMLLANYSNAKNKIANLLESYVNIFNKIFNIFKATNEAEFNAEHKNIIKEDFKLNNKNLIRNKKLSLNNKTKSYKDNKRNKKAINDSCKKIKLVDNSYNEHKEGLQKAYDDEINKLNIVYEKQTSLLLNNIKSLTYNITFLRNRSDNKIAILNEKLKADLKEAKAKNTEAELKNDTKLKNSMRLKRIESNSLNNIKTKNINEIIKEKNSNKIELLTEKDKIVYELKSQKKQYQKKRFSIIADNNKKLLKARIKHNEEVRKIKLDAENKDLNTPNKKITTYLSSLFKSNK